MMDNYKNSLPRKRRRFWEPGEKRKSPTKFTGTKEDLEKLVWKMPLKKISEKYGLSGGSISKICRKWKIKKPLRGYWQKKDN